MDSGTSKRGSWSVGYSLSSLVMRVYRRAVRCILAARVYCIVCAPQRDGMVDGKGNVAPKRHPLFCLFQMNFSFSHTPAPTAASRYWEPRVYIVCFGSVRMRA
jgi:hypothetical protein